MPKAVRFDRYGDIDVLTVEEVERPAPEPGQVLVRMVAAGINPGEASIRKGLLHEQWPATFPSGQGSDLAGTVEVLGAGVEGLAVGDAVVGHVDTRGSHAEFVVAEASDLVPKPEAVPWEVAGSLFVAGSTAYAAVRAVDPQADEVVVVTGAAGGVGSLAVQLAHHRGATVVGLASNAHHQWLEAHGVIPVAYGEGVVERIRAAAQLHGGKVDALVDTYGDGYVALAIDELGVAPERIDTIIDFGAAARYGTKNDGSMAGSDPSVLAELLALIADGHLDVPIAAVYPLDAVRDAYTDLERRHTLGKIVLRP